MRALLSLAAAVALATSTGGVVPAADAAPLPPADLHVLGGDGWRADPGFDLEWTNPAPGDAPLLATHYRVRDPQGAEISAGRLDRVSESVAGLAVADAPGVYSAEVWLEDTTGAEGAAASVPVRFDDAVPPTVGVAAMPGWVGRTSFPLRIALGPPLGSPPLAGIRGYAVAIDSVADGAPCAMTGRCSEAETTLPGGAQGTLEIATLPAGIRHLHVATVSGSGLSSTAAHTTLRIDATDPVTRLAGVPRGWTNRPVALTALAVDDGAGMRHDGQGPAPLTAIRVDGGAPRSAPGSAVGTVVIGEGRHTVAHYARDAAGNVNDGGGANGSANRAPAIAVVRIDRSAPRAAFAASQPAGDPDLIRLRVADPLSGPDLTRGRIEARPAGSGDPFRPLPSAPPGRAELRARWDSDTMPAGIYELRAIAYDMAGNATIARRRRNGTAMLLSSPLKRPTALLAGFGGRKLTWHRCTRRRGRRRCRRETIASFDRRPAGRTVPYGRGVRLGGRLTSATGEPVVGAAVQLTERFAKASGAGSRTSTARTGPDGVFLARLAPGPSRVVAVGFAGDRRLVRAVARNLRLRVRSRVRMRASTRVAAVGGDPLVFRGRVAALPGGIPGDGLSVQLQFRLPGLPWTEFRTARTDERGRFRYAYRFSDDDSRGARFLFRAHVPAQGEWPYEPGSSRPLAVRGR